MKLATYWSAYGPRLAAVTDDDLLVDLQGAVIKYFQEDKGYHGLAAYHQASVEMPSDAIGFLRRGEPALELARKAVAWLRQRGDDLAGLASGSDALVRPVSSARLLPPVPSPSKIWAMRANYQDHLEEMAKRRNQPPKPPKAVGFFKSVTSLIGHDQPIILPPEAQNVEHELELAVVIGKPGENIPEEKAFDYVAGYTIHNDVSARDVARADDMWIDRSKGFRTFGPTGPYLVTKDEIPEPPALAMSLRVNGALRQQTNSELMLFNIPFIISWISRVISLDVGDMILTGTCAGVGPIEDGDVVELEIEGIGVLRNPVRRES